MKMASGFAALMVTCAAATTVAVSANGRFVPCEADHQCGKEKYCYIQSGTCVPCTDCSVYHRAKKVYPNCPKTAQECGKCEPGFLEDILTEGEMRGFCVPSTSPPDLYESVLSSIYIIGISVVAVVGIILAIVCLVFRRCWKKEPDRNNLEDLSPPPYTDPLLDSHIVTPARSVITSEIGETRLQFCREKEQQFLDQAVPFREPYGNSEEEEEPSGDSPLALQDENTVESVWAPPPGYGQVACEASGANNETNDNDVPVSSQPGSSANTQDDSGLSSSSRGNSSNSLSQRPFECFGSSSNSSLPAQQMLATTRVISQSDEDISGARFSKRARRDSGTQSLDEDTGPSNIVIINVQQVYKYDS